MYFIFIFLVDWASGCGRDTVGVTYTSEFFVLRGVRGVQAGGLLGLNSIAARVASSESTEERRKRVRDHLIGNLYSVVINGKQWFHGLHMAPLCSIIAGLQKCLSESCEL